MFCFDVLLSFAAHWILVEVAGGITAQMFIGAFGIVLLVGLLGSLHCTAAYRLGPWSSALRSSVLMTRVDWFGMIDVGYRPDRTEFGPAPK